MDQAFSVPKCVNENVRKILRVTVVQRFRGTKEELESILGRKFMGYASLNFSDFERQKQKE